MNKQEFAMLKRLSYSQNRTMSEIVRELIWHEYKRYYLDLFRTQIPDLGVDNSAISDIEEGELQIQLQEW